MRKKKKIQTAVSTMEKMKQGQCDPVWGCLTVVDKVLGRGFLEQVTVGPKLEF